MVRNNIVTIVGSAFFIAAAWGADLVVERVPAAPEPTGPDATKELKWDSGAGSWYLTWYTGEDSWVGNDFDISTISTYRAINVIRAYSNGLWPNGRWDGFRVGIYDFSGSVPGSLLWGPVLRVPSGPSGWKDYPVGWVLPASYNKFVAAIEQYFDRPNCDPYTVDNNLIFLRHSWQYYEGRWGAHEGYQGYRNLMLRVVVDETVAITPGSLGRVKALYH